MRKCILVMDDEGLTAITAQGGTVLRDETQGATTADCCVEMEEGNVEGEEATFVAVHNYLLATEEHATRVALMLFKVSFH